VLSLNTLFSHTCHSQIACPAGHAGAPPLSLFSHLLPPPQNLLTRPQQALLHPLLLLYCLEHLALQLYWKITRVLQGVLLLCPQYVAALRVHPPNLVWPLPQPMLPLLLPLRNPLLRLLRPWQVPLH
jgi:hypothetical protein